ncbi:MAG: hypothetical protein IPN70_02480 [Candidatus Moraniibacteriota bacterium]|nr:MAG: hypothetical protein IPN70_02480 [Candidatus Moranbacteria bacterium]
MFFIVVIWLVSTSQKMQIIFQLKNLENILPQKELMEGGKEIYKETEELKYNTLQQLETQYDDKNVKSEDEQQNLNISNTDQIREKN